MSETIVTCKFCLGKFKNYTCLKKHQNSAKYCKEYQSVLFFCQKCSFKTKGIYVIKEHISNCKAKNIIQDPFENYTKTIQQLEKQLSEINIESVEEEKRKYLSKKQKYTKKIQQLETEKETYEETIQQLENTLEEEKKKYTSYEETIQQLENTLQLQEEEKKEYMSEKETCEETIENLVKENRLYMSERENYNKKIQQLEDLLNDPTRLSSASAAEKEKNEKETDNIQLQMEKLKNKIYRNIIHNNTTIRLDDVVLEEEDGLHLYPDRDKLKVVIHNDNKKEKSTVKKKKRITIIEPEDDLTRSERPPLVLAEPSGGSQQPRIGEKSDLQKIGSRLRAEEKENDQEGVEERKEERGRKREGILKRSPSHSPSKRQSFRSLKNKLPLEEEESEYSKLSRIKSISREVNEQKLTPESRQKREEILDRCFANLRNSSDSFDDNLSIIKKTRTAMLKHMSVEDYVLILNRHIRMLETIFSAKELKNRKIQILIQKSLGTIDARLVKYHDYHCFTIDIDEINNYTSSLKLSFREPEDYEPFSLYDFIQKIQNLTVCLYPLSRCIELFMFNIYGFNNIIYIKVNKKNARLSAVAAASPPEGTQPGGESSAVKDDNDPFRFYTFKGIENSKRRWTMDCRLEDLAYEFTNALLPYLISIFRNIYKDYFRDNDYRENYYNKSPVLGTDCEQLVQNILTLSNHKQFCKLLQRLVIKNATHIVTENDSFNLYRDDPLQRREFEKNEETNYIDNIKQMFDGISDEEAENFLTSKTNMSLF